MMKNENETILFLHETAKEFDSVPEPSQAKPSYCIALKLGLLGGVNERVKKETKTLINILTKPSSQNLLKRRNFIKKEE